MPSAPPLMPPRPPSYLARPPRPLHQDLPAVEDGGIPADEQPLKRRVLGLAHRQAGLKRAGAEGG